MRNRPNTPKRGGAALPGRPAVWVTGRADHPDFRDVMMLLRGEAAVLMTGDCIEPAPPPELIIVIQQRPGAISSSHVERLRRRAPLASIIVVVGSWCEAEPRTGRPIEGALRILWYEFPSWWRRQLMLRELGECPDWVRPPDFGLRISECGLAHAIGDPIPATALIVMSAPSWDFAESLAGALRPAGFVTVWCQPGRPLPHVRGVTAGVWVGGQIDERVANELAAFCRCLGRERAPVVALLDFPRRDSHDQAIALGAIAVLGMPWINANLIETVRWSITHRNVDRKAA